MEHRGIDTGQRFAGETLPFGWLDGALGNAGSTISADYPIVLTDRGRVLLHDASDDNPRTFTIPANGSIAIPVYSLIFVVNLKNTLSIAITTDTLTLANSATTGTRTLAVNGIATLYKIATTSWLCWGLGLT